ncbi:hypothetical protein ASZ90_007820 [hydrocarbon metagenome]|uniref:Uncharacterized protein n=1 Tax=hydrocarbon metagenome TaxID=938273 RepID=A0A0W8FNF7_9ZZZZ
MVRQTKNTDIFLVMRLFLRTTILNLNKYNDVQLKTDME